MPQAANSGLAKSKISSLFWLGEPPEASLDSGPCDCAAANGVVHRKTIPFMKEYPPADIRNFAVVGHASSGKTMLAEAMLACGGVINRMGSIAAGTTASDYHESEKNRQISVSASLLHLEWLGKKFNILDCPGYADFISEGLGALRVGG